MIIVIIGGSVWLKDEEHKVESGFQDTFSTCNNMTYAINNLITITIIITTVIIVIIVCNKVVCHLLWLQHVFFLKMPSILSFSSKDNPYHCLPHNNMPIKNWTWFAKTGVPVAIS